MEADALKPESVVLTGLTILIFRQEHRHCDHSVNKRNVVWYGRWEALPLPEDLGHCFSEKLQAVSSLTSIEKLALLQNDVLILFCDTNLEIVWSLLNLDVRSIGQSKVHCIQMRWVVQNNTCSWGPVGFDGERRTLKIPSRTYRYLKKNDEQ